MEGVKKNGTLIGARKQINFIEGTNVTIDIDDDADPVNDIDITINASGGGGSSIKVQEEDTTVVTTVDTLDFGAGFDVTESPANEGNITLDASEVSGAPATQAFGDAGVTGTDPLFANRLHKHPMMADPTTAHVAAGDPHTQYALDTDLTTHAGAADPHTGYVLESLLDAAGDMYEASADNTPAKLSIGNPGQILTDGAGSAATRRGSANPIGWGYVPSGITVENFPRPYINTTAASLASGTIRIGAISIPKNFPVASISFISNATAYVAGTNIHFWVALWDSALALLRQSTDNTSGPGSGTWGASSLLTTTLSSSFSTTYSGLHYIGLMISQTGGTIPGTAGFTVLSTGGPAIVPATTGTSSTGQTTTAPNPAAAITPTTVWLYGGVA